MANAGHLAPYLARHQIAVENGLPLGIAAETDYPEVSFQLLVGSQLTLYTDGVVEARARSGELFGFDRAAGVSHAIRGGDRPNSAEFWSGRRHHRAHHSVGNASIRTRDSAEIPVHSGAGTPGNSVSF